MPASLTKHDLSTDDIESMLRQAFGAGCAVGSIEEFTEGYFASVYGVRVTPAGGQPLELVLKVGARPGPHLLRYEVDLLSVEVEFFARAAAGGVPVPGLRYVDPEHRFLVMDRLAGVSLEAAKQSMTPEQLERVRHEVGGVCRQLRTVTGELFGYPRRDGHTRSGSWRLSFLTILDDILADAADHGVALPVPADEIRARIGRHAALLDQVRTPVLVHFDLWDGNVFVAADPAGDWHVTGLIDGERAFYGDPIAELVSLVLFTEPSAVPGVLPGLLGRDLTADERVRLRLYDVYLLLILVTEGGPRGWTAAADLARLEGIASILARELDLL
jgi:aminoglycoside phosphotransferase (APT) family kinase protein